MRTLSRMTVLGIVLVILSPLFGIAGTIFGIYGSFDVLKRSESAGISAVGSHLELALLFSIAGILGTIAGVSFIVFGLRNARKP